MTAPNTKNHDTWRLSDEALQGYIARIQDELEAGKRALKMYEDALKWRREFND